MKIETDINRIANLTRLKEDDYKQYQRLIRDCDLTPEEIDALVQRHSAAVSEAIECRECGNCCKVFRPELKAEDIDRLACHLEIPREDFMPEYIADYGRDKGCFFKLTPCPFLANNACTVYTARPGACRLYPNLCGEAFLSRLDQVFSGCSVCPIVYNVYELVKMEIKDRKVDDNARSR